MEGIPVGMAVEQKSLAKAQSSQRMPKMKIPNSGVVSLARRFRGKGKSGPISILGFLGELCGFARDYLSGKTLQRRKGWRFEVFSCLPT
jgi:hypothetical protein